MGLAVNVAEQRVVELAVPHADPGRNLAQCRLARILNSISIHIQEGFRPQMRLPREGAVRHVQSLAALHIHRPAGAVDNQIIPLIEDHQSPIPVGNTVERENAVCITLLE